MQGCSGSRFLFSQGYIFVARRTELHIQSFTTVHFEPTCFRRMACGPTPDHKHAVWHASLVLTRQCQALPFSESTCPSRPRQTQFCICVSSHFFASEPFVGRPSRASGSFINTR